MKQFKILSARFADRLLHIPFVENAVNEQATLDAFKGKPSPLILAGVLAIIISFVIGWPAVAALGAVSLKTEQPWIAVVGCPLIYGLSHLLFILGMYLSGGKYTLIFLRWFSRISVEKLQTWSCTEPDKCNTE
jgi:hypothetical protein